MKNSKYEIRNFKLKRRKVLLILIAVAVIAASIVFLLVLPYRQINQNPSYSAPSPVPELTEEEKYILNPPLANASSSAKEKHREIVARLSKQTESIEIKDCRPNPVVVKIKIGSEIKIKNHDNVERKIIIDSKNIFKIAPGEEKMIKTQFKYGSGDYGYVCEGSGIVGFMHVVDTE